MTAGQLAIVPTKSKPITAKGGARRGAGRKTDAERESDEYIDYNRARAKREMHNANLAELEERRLRGELGEMAEITRAGQAMAVAFRAKSLAIPVKAAPLVLGLTTVAEIEQVLRAAVEEALTEIADLGRG